MGLLDDAIREHLDLQRRRGADPADVERAEREALGPVRRGPEEPEPTELEHDAGADDGLAYDQQEEQDWGEPPEEEPEVIRPVAPSPPPADEATDALAPAEPLAPEEPIAAGEPPALDEPAAETAVRGTPAPHPAPGPPVPEPGPEHPGEETAEYDVEDALADQPEKKSEDVLEKTPEFLQDTPEHDRLWFEQRPPRDFDFEG